MATSTWSRLHTIAPDERMNFELSTKSITSSARSINLRSAETKIPSRCITPCGPTAAAPMNSLGA